jgi:hypothetical protein
LVLLLAVPFSRFAAAAEKVIQITYGSAAWNTDSTKLDSAVIALRDSTGNVLQIRLEETEPDSAQFTGSVSLDVQDGNSPEIYVPPPELRAEKDGKKLIELVNSGWVQRKPVIWKKNERGQAVLDIYDTRDQADAALKAYQEQERLAQELKKKKPLKPMTDADARAAVATAAHRAALENLAYKAAQHESERVRLEQLESQRAEERERVAKGTPEEQKAERAANALQVSEQAMALYNGEDYAGAEGKFKEAASLDPENKSHYYKYGITLYRNKKYNEALVVLKLAKVDASAEVERGYYMGLVYFRLAELDNAIAKFNEVAKSTDPILGPSALFYQGVIFYSQEKYEASKKAFGTVIDVSKDSRLDAQAEDYLERVDRTLAFQKMGENKFTLIGVVGVMYDSNVLLNPSNSQGTGQPTNSPDFRLATLADLQYRPVFTEHHELAPHVTANLTNSVKSVSAKADPFLYDAAVPYIYKTKFGGKDARLGLTGTYEWLFMDPNGTGTKFEEMGSYFFDLDTTIAMNSRWNSMYTLEYRNDNSMDPSSVGMDDMSANKYTLRTVQTFFTDKSKKQALMPALAYVRNAAKGELKVYNRYDIGLTYLRPVMVDMTWTLGATYYNMTFPNPSPGSEKRIDNNYALVTSLAKPVKDWLVWGVTATYIKNASTDVPSAFDKYLVLTTATFNTAF